MLSKTKLELFEDMHMTRTVKSWERTCLIFVDLGVIIYNQEKEEKYHYFKMVTNDNNASREVYLLAVSED
jgi:hypothetical protein